MVTAMLEQVVEEGGTGTKAQIAGVRVAGKTGTSQKVEPGTGRYSPDARVASFVGFLPADAPRCVILVMVDEPQTSKYGGMVAAPIFQAIGAGGDGAPRHHPRAAGAAPAGGRRSRVAEPEAPVGAARRAVVHRAQQAARPSSAPAISVGWCR